VTSYLAKLKSRGTLELSGPDSRSFLQGQTTCDIDQLSETQSLVGAYCNPQGRMVSDFRLWQLNPERLLITLAADVAATTLETFAKYIVFSRAEMRAADSDWVHYALWGPGAAEMIQPTSEQAHSAWRDGDTLWVVSDVTGAFEACVPAAAAAAFEDALAAAEPAGDEDFHRLELEAGIGHVCGKTSGLFLPQMLNYQTTGRLSFSKGCYTGQEVVARMHYRGKVKRPMALAAARIDSVPEPGAAVLRAGSDQTAGHVVSAVRGEDGGVLLLAAVARDAIGDGATLAGAPLAFRPLPYSGDEG
jgi:hypothetical protein